MKRKDVLAEAERAVNGNREEDYGSPESNFETIAKLWSIYLDKDIDPQDVAAMMILLKISRIKNGPGKDDNWIDVAGYAACGGELSPEKATLSQEDLDKIIDDISSMRNQCDTCKYFLTEYPSISLNCKKCNEAGYRIQWEPREEEGERNG